MKVLARLTAVIGVLVLAISFCAVTVQSQTLENDHGYPHTRYYLTPSLPIPDNFPTRFSPEYSIVVRDEDGVAVNLPDGLVFQDGALTGSVRRDGVPATTITLTLTVSGTDQKQSIITMTICGPLGGSDMGGNGCRCELDVSGGDNTQTQEFVPVIDPSSRLGFDAAGNAIVDVRVTLSVFESNPQFSIGDPSTSDPDCTPTRVSAAYPSDCQQTWSLQIPYGTSLENNNCAFDISKPTNPQEGQNTDLAVSGFLRVGASVIASDDLFRGEYVVQYISRPMEFLLYAPWIMDLSICEIRQLGPFACNYVEGEMGTGCNGNGDCDEFSTCQCYAGYAGPTCRVDEAPPAIVYTPEPGAREEPDYLCCQYTGLDTDYDISQCFSASISDINTDPADIAVTRDVTKNGGSLGLVTGTAELDSPALDFSTVTNLERGISSQHEYVLSLTADDGTAAPLQTQAFRLCDIEPPVIYPPPDVLTNDPGNLPTFEICEEGQTDQCYDDNTGALYPVQCDGTAGCDMDKQNPPVDDNTPDGEYTVCYITKDYDDNVAYACYNVVVDRTPPLATCPDNEVLQTQGGNSRTTTLQSLQNSEAGATVSIKSKKTGTTYNVGDSVTITLNQQGEDSETFTYTITDAAGNSASCDFIFTVQDQEAPTLDVCPAGSTIGTAANGDASTVTLPFEAPDFKDNVGVASVTTVEQLTNPAAVRRNPTFTNRGPGTYTFDTTASDYAPNESVVCTTIFTVVDDSEPAIDNCPVPTAAYDTDAGQNYHTYDVSGYAYTDNIDGSDGSVAEFLDSNGQAVAVVGGTIQVPCCGPSTFTYQVTDSSGNVNDECVFTVTVEDNENPDIQGCPAPDRVFNVSPAPDRGTFWVRITASGVQQVTPDESGATPNPPENYIDFTDAGAYSRNLDSTDNSGGSLLIGRGAGTPSSDPIYASLHSFSLETQQIEFFVQDESGNRDTCIIYFKNLDVEPPILDCPLDTTTSFTSTNKDYGVQSFSLTTTDNGPLTSSSAECTYKFKGQDITVPTSAPDWLLFTTGLSAFASDPYSRDDRTLALDVTSARFDVGATEVSCWALDAFGQVNPNSCTFIVTIEQRCGDSIVGGTEECDGGTACSGTCTCEGTSVPANPPGKNCATEECASPRVGSNYEIQFDSSLYCVRDQEIDYTPREGTCDYDTGLSLNIEILNGNLMASTQASSTTGSITVTYVSVEDNLLLFGYDAALEQWVETGSDCGSVNSDMTGTYDATKAGDTWTFHVCKTYARVQTGVDAGGCKKQFICKESFNIIATTDETAAPPLADFITKRNPNVNVQEDPELSTTVFNPGQEITFTFSASASGDGVYTAHICKVTVKAEDQVPPELYCVPEAPQEFECKTRAGENFSDDCSPTFSAQDKNAQGNYVQLNPTKSPALSSYSLNTIDGTSETYDLTISAEDANGNTDTCLMIIRVVDEEEPIVTCGPEPNLTRRPATSADKATVDTADFQLSATDNSQVTPSCTVDLLNDDDSVRTANVPQTAEYAIGTHRFRYTCTDPSGNESSCIHVLEVYDENPPDCGVAGNSVCQISVSDYQLPLSSTFLEQSCFGDAFDAEAQLAYSFRIKTTDPEAAYSSSLSLSARFAFDVPEFIEARIDDGEFTTVCEATLTLVDTGNPTIFCPASSGASASYDIDVEYDDLTGAYFANTELSLDVADNSYTESETPTSQTADDDLTVTSNGNPADTFTVGSVITITYSVQDAATNEGQCESRINVVDTVSPTLEDCPVYEITSSTGGGEELANGKYRILASLLTQPTYSDNYDSTGPTATLIAPAPDANGFVELELGDNTLQYEAQDSSGNANNECNAVVTLVDDVDPEITIDIPGDDNEYVCGGNLDVELSDTESSYELYYVLSVVENLSGPVTFSTDLTYLGEARIVSNPAANGLGEVLGLDPNTEANANVRYVLTFSATDGAGNTKECVLNVLVRDVTPPTFECPVGPIQQRATSGCHDVVLASPTVEDNVAGAQVTVSIDEAATGATQCPNDPTQYSVSSTCETSFEVVITARDQAGNENTTPCRYTVEVLPAFDDNEADRDVALIEAQVVRTATGATAQDSTFGVEISFLTDIPYPYSLSPVPLDDPTHYPQQTSLVAVSEVNQLLTPSYVQCPNAEEYICDRPFRSDSCGQQFDAFVNLPDGCDASESSHNIKMYIQCLPNIPECEQDPLVIDLQFILRVDDDLCSIQEISGVTLTATMFVTSPENLQAWNTDGNTDEDPVIVNVFGVDDPIVAFIKIEPDLTGSVVDISGTDVISASTFYYDGCIDAENAAQEPNPLTCENVVPLKDPDGNEYRYTLISETQTGTATVVSPTGRLVTGTRGTQYAVFQYVGDGAVFDDPRHGQKQDIGTKLLVAVAIEYNVASSTRRRLLTFEANRSGDPIQKLKQIADEPLSSIERKLLQMETGGESAKVVRSFAAIQPGGGSTSADPNRQIVTETNTGAIVGAALGAAAAVACCFLAFLFVKRRKDEEEDPKGKYKMNGPTDPGTSAGTADNSPASGPAALIDRLPVNIAPVPVKRENATTYEL